MAEAFSEATKGFLLEFTTMQKRLEKKKMYKADIRELKSTINEHIFAKTDLHKRIAGFKKELERKDNEVVHLHQRLLRYENENGECLSAFHQSTAPASSSESTLPRSVLTSAAMPWYQDGPLGYALNSGSQGVEYLGDEGCHHLFVLSGNADKLADEASLDNGQTLPTYLEDLPSYVPGEADQVLSSLDSTYPANRSW